MALSAPPFGSFSPLQIMTEIRDKCLKQLGELQFAKTIKVAAATKVLLHAQEQFKLAIGCQILHGK
eukprot:2964542-Pyramimonas_sp.AAC.2